MSCQIKQDHQGTSRVETIQAFKKMLIIDKIFQCNLQVEKANPIEPQRLTDDLP